jgi:hypothetical protein
MVTRPHGFRHSDVKRAFRAAEAAGVRNPRIEVHLPSGGHFVIGSGGEGPEAPPKKSRPLRADLAEGGDPKMLGKGDRTRTASADAAGTQQAGSTAHKTSSRGSTLAEGGSSHGMHKRQGADPARAGVTAKTQSSASPKQASGGLSRPARPGECGT